ncbi:MAG TPA: hypothetical protein VFH97_04535 [Gemmatimonadales bacterium]|nr:hypothetical protein [Gemmatimonadales bacterium]
MWSFGQDLTISLQEDKPGALARVLAVLAAARLNVEGYAEIEGLLHVLADDAAAAREALERAGVRVRRQRAVLVVGAANEVGKAAGIFRRIADAGINVHFSYVAAGDRMVIGADRLNELADMPLEGGA